MKKKQIKELMDNATQCSVCKVKFGLLQVKVLNIKTKQVLCEYCDS